MSRSAVLGAVLAVAGCHQAYLQPVAAPGRVPVGTPTPIQVDEPPPPARPDPTVFCTHGAIEIPGHWDWTGSTWRWIFPWCEPVAPGYVYIPPFYQDGILVRGYFADVTFVSDRPLFATHRSYQHPPGTFLRHDPIWWREYHTDPRWLRRPLIIQPGLNPILLQGQIGPSAPQPPAPPAAAPPAAAAESEPGPRPRLVITGDRQQIISPTPAR